MKNIMPWIILGNALVALGVLVVVLIAWVSGSINAPDCNGTAQSVCRVVSSTKAATTSTITLPTSSEVEAKINEWRVSQGLAAFNSEVPALDEAAQVRAEGMCADNDWSHAKDWAVLSQYYDYATAGENLYYGTERNDQAADSVKTWVASPTHLENLMKNYTQIGVGVKSCPGFQGDNHAVIITNYFGVPR